MNPLEIEIAKLREEVKKLTEENTIINNLINRIKVITG